MHELLQQLIRDFDDSPANSGAMMRELLEKNSAAFLPAALAALRQARESCGYRYLVVLLARNDLLAKCVCDPSLSTPAALLLARVGMQISPALDTALARELVKGLGTAVGGGIKHAIRMLEILDEIYDGRRLLPQVTNLLQHQNPHIRSKVALLLGRRNKNAGWVQQRKGEPDPRVRANAIEGLWGAGYGARRVLWEASRDPHNRVAGNALLGLYRLGESGVIEQILEMAGHPESRFRASAAWVMGESADPRFLTALGPMLADGDKTVRSCAFRSMAIIRRRSSELAQQGRLHVHLWEARRLVDGSRRLRLTLVDENDGFPALSATRFLVAEGSQALTCYEVRRRPAPVALAVGFGLPGGEDARASHIRSVLLECLRHKRPGHRWALAPYHQKNPAQTQAAGGLVPPGFSAKAATLALLIERRLPGAEAAAGLLDAARSLLAAATGLSGERHLVLIASPEHICGRPENAMSIAQKGRSDGVTIHGLAVAGGGSAVLRVLCEGTGGHLLHAQDEEQIRAALCRIFWGLQYQDEIQYRLAQAETGAVPVRVQIRSDAGMTEDCLELE